MYSDETLCSNVAFEYGARTASLNVTLENGALPETPAVAGMKEWLAGIESHATSVLQFLRVRDIVAFHFTSHDCYTFCRSPRSDKLLVPTFTLQRHWIAKVELADVEVLYADDAKLVTFFQNEEFRDWLAACNSLRELYCSHNQKMMVQPLAHGLNNLPHLVVLDLAHNDLGVKVQGRFKQEQSLDCLFSTFSPHIRILDLSYNVLRDDHAIALVDSLELRCSGEGCGLEQLRLRSNYLGSRAGLAFGHLMKGPAGTKLSCLDMRTNTVDEEGACAMLLALKDHPRMKEMRVGYNRQNTQQDLETAHLACILLQRALSARSHNCLQMLDLNNVRVGDQGTKRMSCALALNMVLTRLDMAFNSIGPEGAQALATALERNRHLKHLDLRDNEIQDEGAQALAVGLAQNGSLEKLLLARNGISSRGGLSLMAAIRANECLNIDFGASGGKLQGVMRRTPRMADYHFMRAVEREDRERASAESAAGPEGLTSLMFSQ